MKEVPGGLAGLPKAELPNAGAGVCWGFCPKEAAPNAGAAGAALPKVGAPEEAAAAPKPPKEGCAPLAPAIEPKVGALEARAPNEGVD